MNDDSVYDVEVLMMMMKSVKVLMDVDSVGVMKMIKSDEKC